MNLTPDHFYGLDGTLDDQFGGPNLQANGGILGTERYEFSANQGLRLEGALADPASYTIVVSLELDAVGGYYRKLIDFQDLSNDFGLYLSGPQLQLYPEPSAPGNIPLDTEIQLILSRDGQTGEVSLYFDGTLLSVHNGPGSTAALPSNNVLTFFEDDFVTGRSETVSGSVDYIALYNAALTPDEIAGTENQAPSVDADQSNVTVAEGQTATNTGSWSDADGDSVSLAASVGAVEKNDDGTWFWSFNTTDGPNESQTVIVTAKDNSGNSSSTSFELTVNNVAPAVGIGDAYAPDHFYDLNGNLDDEMGGPSLIANGGVLGADGYFFSDSHGLRLTGALADTGTYSIVLSMQVDSLSPFFKKLIDFRGRTSDYGVYLSGDTLQLYPGPFGTDPVTSNSPFQVVLTRDGQTGETRVYLDGAIQQVYTGIPSEAAIVFGNELTFFEDDVVTGVTESASGFADHIAVYNRALSEDEVAGLNLPAANSGGSSKVTVDEGETATNTGFWSDPGDDEVVFSASVGQVTKNSDGSWDWSYATTDGPSESQTVLITANDGDGGVSSTSFELVVQNVAPTITSLATDHDTFTTAAADGDVALLGTFTDPGAGDKHAATIYWGDGTSETLSADALAQGQFAADHHYTGGGVFSIRVVLTDSDGAQTEQTTTAIVQGIGLIDGTLYVIGTDGNDVVNIRPSHRRGHKYDPMLKVMLKSRGRGRFNSVKEFPASETGNIVVFTGAGNDQVLIHRKIRINAIIMGGDGNDVLKGGGGRNVLVGGDGRDFLFGGKHGDILVGGKGRDLLFARRGQNLFIGDSAVNEDNIDALQAALAGWLADDSAAAEAALGEITEDHARDLILGRRR